MSQPLTFGSFRFEPATARLLNGDVEVRLTRKAAQVLGALLERPGEPVSKQQLFDSVWRGTVVSDDALVTCIQELRKALGDDSKQPLFIETRHRMGYRFVAPIDAPSASSAAPASQPEAAIDLRTVGIKRRHKLRGVDRSVDRVRIQKRSSTSIGVAWRVNHMTDKRTHF
jgi:DNA-binding winged helix-turn-helix (wHTH) protein